MVLLFSLGFGFRAGGGEGRKLRLCSGFKGAWLPFRGHSTGCDANGLVQISLEILTI